MLNEIKNEIVKMHSFYEETEGQLSGALSQMQEYAISLNLDFISNIIKDINSLKDNLSAVVTTLDTTETALLFEKVLTSIDVALEQIPKNSQTFILDKLLGILDQIREMHCIQWDYFDTFDEVLKDCSPSH